MHSDTPPGRFAAIIQALIHSAAIGNLDLVGEGAARELVVREPVAGKATRTVVVTVAEVAEALSLADAASL